MSVISPRSELFQRRSATYLGGRAKTPHVAQGEGPILGDTSPPENLATVCCGKRTGSEWEYPPGAGKPQCENHLPYLQLPRLKVLEGIFWNIATQDGKYWEFNGHIRAYCGKCPLVA